MPDHSDASPTPSSTTALSGPASDRRRWEGILDQLERNVLSASELTDAAASVPWTAPVGVGPIPADLVARARALLAAQLETAGRLTVLRDSTRQHLLALRGVAPATTGSVYLDVNG